jgi:hypothetical protein
LCVHARTQETVVMVGQRHEKMLTNGTRAGYFCGDGTGVGKGRQIAAIIADNYLKGRRKSIWFSASNGLAKDARRGAYHTHTLTLSLSLFVPASVDDAVADSLSQTRVQDLDDVGCGQNGNYYIPLYTMPMDITKSIPIDDGNQLARAHLVSPRARAHTHTLDRTSHASLCVCCRLFVNRGRTLCDVQHAGEQDHEEEEDLLAIQSDRQVVRR